MPKKTQAEIKKSIYSPFAGVKWIIEEDGILLVNPKAKISLKLNQTESALWQLNTAKTPQNQLSCFLAVLKGISLAKAEGFIEELFDQWIELRYLEYKSRD